VVGSCEHDNESLGSIVCGISLLAELLLVSQGLCSMKFIIPLLSTAYKILSSIVSRLTPYIYMSLLGIISVVSNTIDQLLIGYSMSDTGEKMVVQWYSTSVIYRCDLLRREVLYSIPIETS
jgi:hypothetical protein